MTSFYFYKKSLYRILDTYVCNLYENNEKFHFSLYLAKVFLYFHTSIENNKFKLLICTTLVPFTTIFSYKIQTIVFYYIQACSPNVPITLCKYLYMHCIYVWIFLYEQVLQAYTVDGILNLKAMKNSKDYCLTRRLPATR